VNKGRDPIVFLGFVTHTISFYLIFLNLPDSSPLGQTDDYAYIFPPSAGVAMLCAFLLGITSFHNYPLLMKYKGHCGVINSFLSLKIGLGDSCFNTQIYSILGGLFPDDSAPAFALFRFTQSGAAAASFFYSSSLPLRIQLGILQFFCVIGSFTFFIVEWEDARKRRDSEFESLIHNPGGTTEEEQDDYPRSEEDDDGEN